MTFSESEKRLLAARATTLQERLGAPADAAAVESVDDPDEWLEEWRRRVANGDEATFRRRLEREGLTPTDAHDVVAAHRLPEGDLPQWVKRLDDLVTTLGESPAPEFDGLADVPFRRILSRIVDHAGDRLDETALEGERPDASAADGQLTAAGRESFDRMLRDRLGELAAHPLFLDFKTFVAQRDRDLVFGDPEVGPDPPSEHYEAFVTDLLDDGLRSFFLEYAFLGRLVVVAIEQWCHVVAEFCGRLADDRAALREQFGWGDELGAVVDVEAAGDRHADGRVVLAVTFESGARAAYKPRPVGVDAAFGNLLDWIAERSELGPFRTPDCLPRDGYGWIEWVEPAPCESVEAVRRYYRRTGALLAVLYALNFTDGHVENVIAAGDQPVVVDLETTLVPDPPLDHAPRERGRAEIVRGSVLRTGLIPQYRPELGTGDLSGFGAGRVEVTDVERRTFTDVNTDVMELAYENTYIREGSNLPRIDGEAVSPDAHRETIEAGFSAAYRFLLDEREALLADNGPLARFEDCEVRFLVRSTGTYASILASLTTPEYLRTGLKFGCKAEGLARPFLTGTVDESVWPVYERERSALARLDVPRFSTTTDDVDLYCGGRVVGEYFESSSLAQVRERVRTLDEADLDEQLDYVRMAFGERRPIHRTGSRDQSLPPEAASDDWFRRQAQAQFDRIAETAKRHGDGPVWYRREFGPDGGVHVSELGSGLYKGRMGIATFGAALAATTGEPRYEAFVAEAVDPVLEELESTDPFADLPIGLGPGVGAVVYGFRTLAGLLDEQRYADAARRAVGLLTDERIARADQYDVLSGSAGGILAALAVADGDAGLAASGDALDRAVACGEHLLANRIEADGGRVWPTGKAGQPLLGFAHGTAGIAYALARLADATSESRFLAAALEAIEYERRQYDPDERNWPDRRDETDHGFSHGWCNGPAGIGLARLGMGDVAPWEGASTEAVEVSPTEAVETGLERALGGVDPGMVSPYDHLCCGNFSRVEFLVEADRRLDGDYNEQARRLATAAVEDADRRGRFAVPFGTDHWYDPTLFGGDAGIGYALLRLVNPELPCLLLFE